MGFRWSSPWEWQQQSPVRPVSCPLHPQTGSDHPASVCRPDQPLRPSPHPRWTHPYHFWRGRKFSLMFVYNQHNYCIVQFVLFFYFIVLCIYLFFKYKNIIILCIWFYYFKVIIIWSILFYCIIRKLLQHYSIIYLFFLKTITVLNY